ncbi:MAG TPA: 50S ribosomal protein L18e [archaeon]|nr:50S ribosomal protein L18e [archaeon]
MKRTGPTNPYLKTLIEDLRKKYFDSKVGIWLAVAEKLAKPRRKKITVNLSDIERNTSKDEVAVVPGIVLASGELTKPVSVAAWRFSDAAKEKIKKSKGKCLTIEELVKENPKGTGVKILS